MHTSSSRGRSPAPGSAGSSAWESFPCTISALPSCGRWTTRYSSGCVRRTSNTESDGGWKGPGPPAPRFGLPQGQPPGRSVTKPLSHAPKNDWRRRGAPPRVCERRSGHAARYHASDSSTLCEKKCFLQGCGLWARRSPSALCLAVTRLAPTAGRAAGQHLSRVADVGPEASLKSSFRVRSGRTRGPW
jgi:hypothetical protein